MFLKAKGLVQPAWNNISRRLLSNEVKEVFKTRFDPPSGTNGNNLPFALVSKSLNPVNLDLFVNNLTDHEDRSSDILELLANLRSTKLTNICLESTHFAVVNHLLEHLTIQELVPVLLDRLRYGIFLNNFTSFAIAQTLHSEKEYILGLPLALKLVLSEETESEFVHGFFLKAALETLKKEAVDSQSHDKEEIKKPKTKVQEKKVRVGFIRNVYKPDVHHEIGNAVLKSVSKFLEGNAKANFEILGHVLTKNFTELEKVLSTNKFNISEDIATVCKHLLSSESEKDFINKISNIQSQKESAEDFIDKWLKEAADKEAPLFAEQQRLLFPIWQEQRAQEQNKFEEEKSKKERKENIEAIGKEIASKREQLWYFDNVEKLNLQIYKKRVFYPKRWFGKKKKPRVVDEHYVPPQIRKIN